MTVTVTVTTVTVTSVVVGTATSVGVATEAEEIGPELTGTAAEAEGKLGANSREVAVELAEALGWLTEGGLKGTADEKAMDGAASLTADEDDGGAAVEEVSWEMAEEVAREVYEEAGGAGGAGDSTDVAATAVEDSLELGGVAIELTAADVDELAAGGEGAAEEEGAVLELPPISATFMLELPLPL